MIYNYFPLMLKFCEFKLLNSISIFFLPHAPLLEARWIDSRVAIQFFHLQAFDCVTRGLLNIYRNLSHNRVEKENAFTELNAITFRARRFVSIIFSKKPPLSYRASVSIRFDRAEMRLQIFHGGTFSRDDENCYTFKTAQKLVIQGED